MRKKVCLVGPVYPYRGGIAHYTCMLAKEFAKDHDVLIVNFKRLYPSFLFPGRTQFDESGEPLAIDSLRLIDSINPISFWRAARAIARFRPDVVVVQWWQPFFAVTYRAILWFLGKSSRAKIVFLCHNVIPHESSPLDRLLTRAGFALDTASDGEDGLWLAETVDYDIIILDLMLPKIDGLTLLKRLREHGIQTHVLILTAKDAVEDRVRGLDHGADDYLIKPFALAELLARVQALVRRKYGLKSSDIVIGDLRIDTSRRVVLKADRPIELRPREYALLEYLAFRRGEVISRAEIEHHIYDQAADVASNVVDSAICSLRRKIGAEGAPSLIETRRGMGYVLREIEP